MINRNSNLRWGALRKVVFRLGVEKQNEAVVAAIVVGGM